MIIRAALPGVNQGRLPEGDHTHVEFQAVTESPVVALSLGPASAASGPLPTLRTSGVGAT